MQLDRAWLNRTTTEAAQRVALVAGLVLVANDCDSRASIVSGAASTSYTRPALPSGSEPGFLKMRQAQQRQQGEHSAAAQLDAERTGRQQLELEVIGLRARLAIKEAQNAQLIEECEQHRRDASDQRRAKLEAEDAQIVMEEQLEKVMVLAEFMNADNPLSPPDGRELVECWGDVTHDGTVDPTKSSGNGWHIICAAWLNNHTASPSEIKCKRFAALLTPLASKKGGTIPTPRK